MAETFETIVSIPHISFPPIDGKNGDVFVPVWYEVWQRMWERTGGDVDLIFQNTEDITGKADKTTQVIAGLGLDGGGTLAADITIDINIDEALDLVGSTVGSLLVRGASGWQIIVPGTDGYVLTSNGVGVLPAYEQNESDTCLPVVKAPTGITISSEVCGTVFSNEKP